MINAFLNASTPTSVVLIILCVIIENWFTEVFKGSEGSEKLKISIDLSDWRQVMFLVVVIGVILSTPGINLLISIIYGFYVIYQIIRYYRR